MIESQKQQIEGDKLTINPTYLLLLQDIFDMQQRVAPDIVIKEEFVEAAKTDPQIKSIFTEPARKSDDIDESIFAFLQRLQQEAPDFI